MKISEARQLYQSQISDYRNYQATLANQKKELEEKMNSHPDGKNYYANEAATLELTMQAIDEKQSQYQDYMEKLQQQWTLISMQVSNEQQQEATEEYVEDIGKIMEVARRLMKGAIVPPNDEKKLMEYSMELYQAAKNIGSLAKQEEKEEYDSLWDEEKKTLAPEEDPIEAADNAEAFASGPAIVDASEIAAVSVEK